MRLTYSVVHIPGTGEIVAVTVMFLTPATIGGGGSGFNYHKRNLHR